MSRPTPSSGVNPATPLGEYGERPAVTLGPVALRRAPTGVTPWARIGPPGRSTARPAVQRQARPVAQAPCSLLPYTALARGRGLGLRPRRASERLPPSFGPPAGPARSNRRAGALQPVPREAARSACTPGLADGQIPCQPSSAAQPADGARSHRRSAARRRRADRRHRLEIAVTSPAPPWSLTSKATLSPAFTDLAISGAALKVMVMAGQFASGIG